MRTILFPALTAAALLVGPSSASADHHLEKKKKASKTIVETAAASGKFDTLVAAVKAAGLVETLSGEGPFTVFAPTDAAFDALPEGTVESLLEPENKKKLVTLLTQHVVKGKVGAKKVMKMDSAQTLQGAKLPIEVKKGKVHVGNATVVKADIKASNGLIHVVDQVIMVEPTAREKSGG